MQWEASLSWLALALTPGLASRLSARVLRRFGSPEGEFRAEPTGRQADTCAPDVMEELPTPVRAALLQAEQPEAEQRSLLVAAALNGLEKKLLEMLSGDKPMHMDDIVEGSNLNSSEVLVRLFNLEMKGIVRQLPGKQFCRVLL